MQKVEIPKIGTIEFPDNMSDEQIAQAIKANYPELHQEKNPTGILPSILDTGYADKARNMTPQELEHQLLLMKNQPKTSFNRGLQDIGEGLKQTGLEMGEITHLLPQGTTQDYTNKIQSERDQYNKSYGQLPGSSINRTAGNIAPYMLLPGIGEGAAAKTAYSTGLGSFIGGSQFVPEGGDRKDNAITGGMLGLGLPLTMGMGAKLGGKLKNAVAQNFKDKSAQEIVGLGSQHKVPVFYPDVGGPTSRKASTMMEDVPLVGMRGPRLAQMDKSKDAAFALKDNFKRFKIGDDLPKTQQKSLEKNFSRVNNTKNNLYNQVNKLTDSEGYIPTNHMNQAAKDLIAKENTKVPEYIDTNLIGKIEKYSVNPKATFRDAQFLRSEIGERISSLQKSTTPQKSVGEMKALIDIKKGLEKDMESFATSRGGKIKQAWKRADTYYRSKFKPMKDDRQLKKWITNNEPDQIHSYYIKANHEDRAKSYYNLLTEQGREATRQKILSDAADKAYDANRKVFSPAKYATEIEKIHPSVKVFFKDKDGKLVDGFTKLMRSVERSGQVFENQPTGGRILHQAIYGGAALGGAYVEPTAVAMGATTTKLTQMMFTKPALRNLLLSASKLDPGSKKMQKIANEVGHKLRTMGIVTGATTNYQLEKPKQ